MEVLSTDEHTPSTGVDYRSISTYFFVAALAAAYLFLFTRSLSDSGDEGISVLNAARVLHGDLPARDFVEAIGPGEFYWLGLFFKFFGIGISVAHGELLFVGVMLAIIVFHLARIVGADPIRSCALITAILIPMFPLNSYHWDSDLFALLSFTALVEWQARGNNWLLSVSGSLAGITTLIMQQKGLLLCGAILLSIVLIDRSKWKKSLVGILIPYCGVLLSVLVFYAAHDALKDLMWANLMWPAFRYSNINHCSYASSIGRLIRIPVDALPTAVPSYVAWVLGCFLNLPLLLVVAIPGLLIVAVAALRGKAFPRRLVPFWICGSALLLSECQRPDVWHLAFGCPILLLNLSAVWRMLKMPRWAISVLSWGIALFICMNGLISLSANKKIETRRGAIYSHNAHSELEFLQAHTHPGDYAFVYPYRPILNFLSDTRNPTRFSYFVYGWHTPEQFNEAVRDLEIKRVRYVLLDTVLTAEKMGVFSNYRVPPIEERVMERYLATRYREVAVKNRYRILERIR